MTPSSFTKSETTGRILTSGGQSQKRLTPTKSSKSPKAQRISVTSGDVEAMRILMKPGYRASSREGKSVKAHGFRCPFPTIGRNPYDSPRIKHRNILTHLVDS